MSHQQTRARRAVGRFDCRIPTTQASERLPKSATKPRKHESTKKSVLWFSWFRGFVVSWRWALVFFVSISHYLADGLPNLAASIATFVLTSVSFAVYLPSSHVNLYSNGNWMPPTSR